MIKVCGHRLLVKPIGYLEDDPTYQRAKALGLTIADHEDNKRARESVDQGTVVQVGPTAFNDFGGAAWCKEGDKIVYAKFAGKLIVDPDTQDKFYAINDEDVVAIVGENA
jgi:co-chaperonin GroES (HSP10)